MAAKENKKAASTKVQPVKKEEIKSLKYLVIMGAISLSNGQVATPRDIIPEELLMKKNIPELIEMGVLKEQE